MNRQEHWSFAIGRLLREDPFLGTIILRCKVKWDNLDPDTVDCDTPSTATIDGDTLTINEWWWMHGDVATNVFRLRHLGAHVAFGHHLRREGRKEDLWHLASDLSINPLLRLGRNDIKCEMPADHGLPVGKTAEWYYMELLKQEQENQQEQQGGNSGEGADDKGTPSGGDDGDGKDRLPAEEGGDEGDDLSDNDGQDGEETEEEAEGRNSGDTSSADQGKKNKLNPNSKFVRCMDDCGAPKDSTKKNGEAELAMTVVQANQNSAGFQAGWEEEMVQKLLNPPPLNPKTLLRLYMTQAAQTKPTFSRTNRRTAWRSDIIMPGKFERTLGKVAVCVDTSGSVSAQELAWSISAINEIIVGFPETEVTVIEADTTVHRVTKYKGQSLPLGTTFQGRGGTLFDEALAVAEKDTPTVILYITDGLPARWPERNMVHTPVVWLMTRKGAVAPWGRQIEVPLFA